MESPHLQVWQSVTVRTGWPQRELIGSWIRVANGLEWRPGEDHSAPGGFSGP
jgi:hypothetical protein